MVAIDDTNNAWRHLVLPIAGVDRLVLVAALAAAKLHFSINVCSQPLSTPINSYTRAIEELKLRFEFGFKEKKSWRMVALAILILLSAIMVSGWDDLPQLSQMLEVAVSAAGGDENLGQDDLGRFLSREVRKWVAYCEIMSIA